MKGQMKVIGFEEHDGLPFLHDAALKANDPYAAVLEAMRKSGEFHEDPRTGTPAGIYDLAEGRIAAMDDGCVEHRRVVSPLQNMGSSGNSIFPQTIDKERWRQKEHPSLCPKLYRMKNSEKSTITGAQPISFPLAKSSSKIIFCLNGL
jgi:hypothetical protein